MEADLLWEATQSIIQTRDGKLRAAVPHPIGTCDFINDLTYEELEEALADHKRICADYPRAGEGVDAIIATAAEESVLAVR
jgi:3-dehydroquinate synthase